MTSQIAGLAIAVRLLVAATVLMGWVVAIQQLLEDGWIAGGGTASMLVFALLATFGAAGAARLHQRGHSTASGVGLLVVAASPTVFAYPLNVAVIVVALALIGRGLTGRLAAERSAMT
jgi:hypothetical protein